MSLQQLTIELINYYEDVDTYDFRDNLHEGIYEETYKSLLIPTYRNNVKDTLKLDIQESTNLETINNAIKLLSALNKLD